MIREHDRVVLTTPVPEYSLEPGDIGVVVFVHKDGVAYEVEFVTLTGKTTAVAELRAEMVRPVRTGEVPHARTLAGA
jgi:hypothetical protein